MTLVLGIDSSTQSTKAVLVDADDGTVVEARSCRPPARAPRSTRGPGSRRATRPRGRCSSGPRRSSVAGQQHGMVALDADGVPVRDALLWNDVRSAAAARDLVAEMGGRQACAEAVGSVLVASFTSTKLRWLRDHEPEAAGRVAEVLLPHDYVSRHLAAPGTRSFTDRGDASGTGYFDTATRPVAPRPARRRPRPRGRASRRSWPGGAVAAATASGRRAGGGHRRQHGRRARACRSRPATCWSRSAPAASSRR